MSTGPARDAQAPFFFALRGATKGMRKRSMPR
jgi:hypothetical protein